VERDSRATTGNVSRRNFMVTLLKNLLACSGTLRERRYIVLYITTTL
jgi:hypothetical protein